MGYAHIVTRDIVVIESYCLKNKSLSYIAAKLKRSKRTINYELKRCKPYNVLLAQADYDAKREDGDYILSKLKLGWSPESIVAHIQKEPNSAG